MDETTNVLALDIGAGSGRAIVGRLSEGKLTLTEVHRFPNVSVRLPDGLHWDLLYLFNEIKTGIRKAVELTGGNLRSVGLDTWGVDFGLLDASGSLTYMPYHYRDSRTDNMMEHAFGMVSKKEIFEQTGLQFMSINTLYQLLALKELNPGALADARTFLTIPDLLNYWLTGRKVSEFSIATTTQCYDPRKGTWAYDLIEKVGLPVDIFPEIIPACTKLGSMLPYLEEELGAKGVSVIAPACHDTGSAVLAVPATDRRTAFISSGTWSLIGIEVPEPLINADSLAMNFTNEGCVGGHFRLLKNITGLWIVQECKRYWENLGENHSYNELTKMAEEAESFQSYIDTDWSEFLKHGEMPIKVKRFCEMTGQPVPATKGAVIRCALESLALKYKEELNKIEKICGYTIETMHIVGGGAQNVLLNQLAANALQRKVITGPIEATAAGNILGQCIALGVVNGGNEARQIVRDSFEVSTYLPENDEEWQSAYEAYLRIRA